MPFLWHLFRYQKLIYPLPIFRSRNDFCLFFWPGENLTFVILRFNYNFFFGYSKGTFNIIFHFPLFSGCLKLWWPLPYYLSIKIFWGGCPNVTGNLDHDLFSPCLFRLFAAMVSAAATPAPVASSSSNGLDPLLRAVNKEDAEEVKKLLVSVTNVDVRDKFGYTPLHKVTSFMVPIFVIRK